MANLINELKASMIVSARATAVVTQEVAGGVVDAVRTTRKAVSIVDGGMDYLANAVQSEVIESKLKSDLRIEAVQETFSDEGFRTKYKKKLSDQLLADLLDESDVETTF